MSSDLKQICIFEENGLLLSSAISYYPGNPVGLQSVYKQLVAMDISIKKCLFICENRHGFIKVISHDLV